MKVPTAAPTNSKKHAVDFMKNPGSRFSTALLYKPEHGRGGVVQVYCAKPKRHQESRHPFKRVHMRAEDALEVGISGRCRELNAELAMRRRDASRKKEKRLRPAM